MFIAETIVDHSKNAAITVFGKMCVILSNLCKKRIASYSLESYYRTCVLFHQVVGHGMMLDPPNRSSLWRFDKTSPPNYNDNQNFCGGRSVQWDKFGGKCGVCGDIYNAPHPQPNENTGKYGQGKVVANYTSGSVITAGIRLTTNHKGNFEFDLCVLKNPSTWEVEECFQRLTFANGTNKYQVSSGISDFKVDIKLPNGLTCERCVLRWHYTTGNHWGMCEDGTGGQGCGPQENFYSCSDVRIY